jgi:hypothetical protein
MAIRTVDYTGDDPLGFVLSSNLHRRHLDESQRAMVAARLATLSHGVRADRQDAPIGASTQPEAAKALSVSRRAVQRARVVQEQAAPELARRVDSGEVAVSVVAKVATLPQESSES